MIVIATLHQPSTSTLLCFDKTLLLSEGNPVYYGLPDESVRYFTSLGFQPSPMMSPAEFMMELTDNEFARDDFQRARLNDLVEGWDASEEKVRLRESIISHWRGYDLFTVPDPLPRGYPRSLAMQLWILFRRMTLVLFSLLHQNLILESLSRSSFVLG